jgi:hypothetical protein
VIRLVAALGVAAVTFSCGSPLVVPPSAHASPDNCPPVCDRIPDSAWIDPGAIPLNSTYSWPKPSALSVTATDHRFRFEQLCATPPPRGDARDYAVAARAVATNPPGQWQLQAQIIHWRGESWRIGQLASDALSSAVGALRACQQTAPQVSPSLTVDDGGRLAAVMSSTGSSPLVTHEYLVSHPASGTVVELAMWASSPPLVGWPAVTDEHLLDTLVAPLCTAYIASCG